MIFGSFWIKYLEERLWVSWSPHQVWIIHSRLTLNLRVLKSKLGQISNSSENNLEFDRKSWIRNSNLTFYVKFDQNPRSNLTQNGRIWPKMVEFETKWYISSKKDHFKNKKVPFTIEFGLKKVEFDLGNQIQPNSTIKFGIPN